MFDRFQNFYIKEEDIMYIKADLEANMIFVAVSYSSSPKIFKYTNKDILLKDMDYFDKEKEWTPFDKLDDLIYINCYYLEQFIIDKEGHKDVLILDFKTDNNSIIPMYIYDFKENELIKELLDDLT